MYAVVVSILKTLSTIETREQLVEFPQMVDEVLLALEDFVADATRDPVLLVVVVGMPVQP